MTREYQGGDFGFFARYGPPPWQYEDEVTDADHKWRVGLPHSCDEWMIAEESTREKAIAELEIFIAAAQESLEKLKTLPEEPTYYLDENDPGNQ